MHYYRWHNSRSLPRKYHRCKVIRREWSENFTAFVVFHFSGKCARVGKVFDRYLPNSIKGVTRAKRKRGKSKGIRRDVESREQRIGNWDRFIVVYENKAILAHFLSTEMSQRYGVHPGLELVVSGGFREILNVWSSDTSRESLQQLPRVRPQDIRIVLHARDAAVRGYYQVSLLCRDTDVLRPSFWRTDKISVKKFGYSPVHFEQRDTVQSKEKRKSPLAFHTSWDRRSRYQRRESSSISQGKEEL